MAAIHGFVSGQVQGVGFRWFVLHRARALGVAGWVRNTRDGRVEFYAQGDPEAVERFVETVGVGPPAAKVAGLVSSAVDVDPTLRGFEIRAS